MDTRYPLYQNNSSIARGEEFQDLVMMELRQKGIFIQTFTSRKYQFGMGENPQGVEIKLDARCLETGQLSIEIAEKSGPALLQYTASGIYRSDNTWLYVQGNDQTFFAFQRNILCLLHKTKKYREHELSTIRKFYLPLSDAHKYAAFVVDRKGR